MDATFRQGESWIQRLSLIRSGQPVSVGPASAADTLIHHLDVLLVCGGSIAARYRYPTSTSQPDILPLSFDASASNVIQIRIDREQSRLAVPGFVIAVVLAVLRDADHPSGRAIEMRIPLGVLLATESASL